MFVCCRVRNGCVRVFMRMRVRTQGDEGGESRRGADGTRATDRRVPAAERVVVVVQSEHDATA